jgi:hypothetical protein
MFPERSPLSVVALASAGGLLLTALVAWLLPVSLASSGFVLFGGQTLADLVPVLHGHRLLLLALGLVGGAVGLASLWGVPPYPGAGVLLHLGLVAEVATLIVTAPVAVLVLALLALNLATWLLLVRVGLAVLRMVAP